MELKKVKKCSKFKKQTNGYGMDKRPEIEKLKKEEIIYLTEIRKKSETQKRCMND